MKRLSRRIEIAALLLTVLALPALAAREIGYDEDFALAKDREQALKLLIPGTWQYYYYNCLHLQNQGKLDEVDKLIKVWDNPHRDHRGLEEIKIRQALLRYDEQPRESLEFIRRMMNLNFPHQREDLASKPDYPTSLDQKHISREILMRYPLAHSMGQFEDSALDWLMRMDLRGDQLRYVLQHLRRPDYPNLPELVNRDLEYKYSRNFGSFQIHSLMLKDQLDRLLEIRPSLLNEGHFVNIYMTKLRPGPDEDWQHDPKVKRAYLDRLWNFVSRLDPVHNSLKANVLYQQLVLDRSQGVYDKERFLAYLKLPRRVNYIEPRITKTREYREHGANLNANYQQHNMLPPIGGDWELVESYLLHFFVKAKDYGDFKPYIHDSWLARAFAEAKITHGIGDMEKWASMISPAQFKALKERIDIDFAYTNPEQIGVDDEVKLDVHIKNVEKLIIKVYRINNLNYYLDQWREVNTDINLDGLVSNYEKVHELKDPPLRRIKRTFTFPTIDKRGTYVVEFIGNGKSSRALIRKGLLRFVATTGAAGHTFTVYDGINRRLNDTSLHLSGHHYEADKDGTIVVPFTNRPGRQPIILVHGDFAALDYFNHEAEHYHFGARFHVDREELTKGNKAEVVIRPSFTISGEPAPYELLEDMRLLITSTDQEGVSSTQTVEDLKFENDQDLVHTFAVPDRLHTLHFSLTATVKNLSQNKDVSLSTSDAFAVNEIDRTENIADFHLLQNADGYMLDVLGKTGEPRMDLPVQVILKHRDFKQQVHVNLKTNGDAERGKVGRIVLGKLQDIERIVVKAPGLPDRTWELEGDGFTYGRSLHGKVGVVLRVPYLGAEKQPKPTELSLLETRGGTFTRDFFESLKINDGFITIDDLPAGDYDLLIKDQNQRITLRLTQGDQDGFFLLGEERYLEVKNTRPVHIASAVPTKENLRIQLGHANKHTRVHVIATRFVPAFRMFDTLRGVVRTEPRYVTPPDATTRYVAGRDIGDEYRYILDRKYLEKFPGNLLRRPELLLNPWAVRSTQTSHQSARSGTEFRRSGEDRPTEESAEMADFAVRGGLTDPHSLDFLAEPPTVLTNLVPDENGVITIDRKLLGDRQHVQIAAVDRHDLSVRKVILEEPEFDYLDVRLRHGLDPKAHFTQQQRITAVQKGETFKIADITTSKFEAYDTLDKAYALMATLNPNENLAQFAFILQWPKLKPETQREKYSEFACHELNFFLYHKDPKFFNDVIKPYLANKKDKTFMDHWLLNNKRQLEGYLNPWAYEQLNIAERAILWQRLPDERPRAVRHITDLYDLLPPDIDRDNHLFRTALKGRALEADGLALGLTPDATYHAPATRFEAGRLGGKRGQGPGGGWNGRAVDGETFGGPAAPAAEAATMPADAARERVEHEAAKKNLESKSAKDRRKRAADKSDQGGAWGDDMDEALGRSLEDRKSVRRYYRKLDPTMEWAENNYYKLLIQQQNASLVPVNAFWDDYVRHDGKTPFLSTNLAEASRNFTEMMLALAVLDLPYEAGEHDSDVADKRELTVKAAGPFIVYHRELRPAEADAEKTPILVSQNFFRHGDRYRHERNERLDKFVTDEFLSQVVYGCQIVITNPTSSPQKLDLLLQIPRGAIPVLNHKYTHNQHISLQPYSTFRYEYFFYFPAAGTFVHYPVHVSKNEKVAAFAEPFTFNVVNEPSKVDTESWDYISQDNKPGSEDRVVEYIKKHNLGRINLERIAWRMHDADFFQRVITLLTARHTYHHTLWSYGIKHNVTAAAREYLKHSDSFLNRAGAYIDCTLVTIDPVERKQYEHLEYRPLVNARAHQLGARRNILNDRFYGQYHRLMKILTYRNKLDDEDKMAVTYYLLLQDRVAEALRFFDQVDPKKLSTRLQYDYFTAYIAFCREDLKAARKIAEGYADHPVDRWRKIFGEVTAQLDQIEGKGPKVVDDESRDQQQTQLAATEPAFEFEIVDKSVRVTYQNLTELKVNFYLMDLELLFSRQPFVQGYSSQFSYVEPNDTLTVKLPEGKNAFTFELPKALQSRNVMVEIAGGTIRKSSAYFSNQMNVQVLENYGQLRATDTDGKTPLAKVYVKVYARMANGAVRFYKDGYTDLRGRFDYASLSTDELNAVQQFAILILSDEKGAVVREASPPKQ